jgi:hypothetical protein
MYRSKSASPTCKRAEFLDESYRPRSVASIATPRRSDYRVSHQPHRPIEYIVTPRSRAQDWEMHQRFTKELHPLTKQRLAILVGQEDSVKPVRPDDKRPRSRCESRASSYSVTDRIEYSRISQSDEIDSMLTEEDKNIFNHFVNMCTKFDEVQIRKILKTAYKLYSQKKQNNL